MNKKVLFTIAPAILLMGALTGCKGGGSDPQPTVKELTELKVESALTPATYFVGTQFTKYGLNVTATWSDGSFNTVKQEDYSVSPELPYTFKDEDVDSGKDFIVTYLTKSQTVHINVKYKTLKATWNSDDECYISLNAGAVTAKTKMNGTVTYNTKDTTGFNAFSFVANEEGDYYDVGINKSDATINVTQVKDANGNDITDNCKVSDDVVMVNSAGTPIKANISMTFTVTKEVTSLWLEAANYK